MNTPSSESLCQQAKQALREGDRAAAHQLFQQAVDLDDSRIEAHEGLATVCFHEEDYGAAAKHFQRVAELDPRQGKPLVNIGAIHNRTGQFQKALDTLRQALQRDKKCPEAFYNMGIAHRRLNQLSMAVSAYKEAVRLAPEMIEAQLNLANVYLEMGNHQQANASFRRVLDARPENERAMQGLKKVEAAMQMARQEFSPFGRLVEEGGAKPKASLSQERVLSVSERIEDRRILHSSTQQIEDAARAWMEQTEKELEPALLALNRIVTQAKPNPVTLSRTFTDYETALANWTASWKLLHRKVLELRGHEEFKNAPELKLPTAAPPAGQAGG